MGMAVKGKGQQSAAWLARFCDPYLMTLCDDRLLPREWHVYNGQSRLDQTETTRFVAQLKSVCEGELLIYEQEAGDCVQCRTN